MTRPATIDVLVPVYNAAPTVRAALLSICRQTLRDVRIIVVDDGSTDETPSVLRTLAAEDARIVVITTPNRGIVDALNAALDASDAEFVARHDADDLADPHRLEVQLAYLRSHADCVAVGCNAHHIDAAGKRTGYVTEFRQVVEGDPYNSPSIEPYLLHPFLLARRAAVVAAGGYRYAFHSEDTDLYWRLAQQGRLANLQQTLGEYRIHPQSVSSISILNGRVSAVSSQLAAVSEQRRRRGASDLVFEKVALDRYKAADSLAAILDIATSGLEPREATYLRTATVTKLLELSSYRPYRLERDDLATIRETLELHYSALARSNRLYVLYKLILGRKRLRRDWREAWQLVPWRVIPRSWWDMALFLPVLGWRRATR